MTGVSPPLRFLTLVLLGWVCLRATLLASAWWQQPVRAAPAGLAVRTPAPAPQRGLSPRQGDLHSAEATSARAQRARLRPTEAATRAPAPILPKSLMQRGLPAKLAPAQASAVPSPPRAGGPMTLLPISREAGRWSGSAWVFVRNGRSGTLAPGGMLGGSQAGGRIAYRLNRDPGRPLALSGRLYAPLDRPRAAEAAAGLDWKPLAGLPLHLLAERRVGLGREGRNAFSLTAYGGVGEAPAGPFLLDAYAQAGMVGLRSRDLFADGAAKLSLPLGRVRLGGGAWAAAQPGASRLDVGPQASVRLPLAGTAVVVAADWRLRAAGHAAPSSGPSLTISTGF